MFTDEGLILNLKSVRVLIYPIQTRGGGGGGLLGPALTLIAYNFFKILLNAATYTLRVHLNVT